MQDADLPGAMSRRVDELHSVQRGVFVQIDSTVTERTCFLAKPYISIRLVAQFRL